MRCDISDSFYVLSEVSEKSEVSEVSEVTEVTELTWVWEVDEMVSSDSF